MTSIAISRLHFPVTTLGPGNRLGIWFQGCSIRCPGCISMDTWASGKGTTSIDEVMEAVTVWLPRVDGFTISGGEPFDQPEALLQLLRRIRALSDLTILVYSGHAFETLEPHLLDMAGLIDVLISDPFEIETSQTRAMRGSDNQRLHILTDLGREQFSALDRPLSKNDKVFDLMMDGTGAVWLAGIPGRGDFNRLKHHLAAQKHRITTTENRAFSSGRRRDND
jgi:anaerobic ribonucleoside-triphosphate reductase activating protein